MIMLGPAIVSDSKSGAEMLAEKIGHATLPDPMPGRDSYRIFSEAKSGPRVDVTVFVHGTAILGCAPSGEVANCAQHLRTIWNSMSS